MVIHLISSQYQPTYQAGDRLQYPAIPKWVGTETMVILLLTVVTQYFPIMIILHKVWVEFKIKILTRVTRKHVIAG